MRNSFQRPTLTMTHGLVTNFSGTDCSHRFTRSSPPLMRWAEFFRVSVAGLLFDAVAFCDATLVISLGLRILAALLHWPIGERGVLRTKAQVG